MNMDDGFSSFFPIMKGGISWGQTPFLKTLSTHMKLEKEQVVKVPIWINFTMSLRSFGLKKD